MSEKFASARLGERGGAAGEAGDRRSAQHAATRVSQDSALANTSAATPRMVAPTRSRLTQQATGVGGQNRICQTDSFSVLAWVSPLQP